MSNVGDNDKWDKQIKADINEHVLGVKQNLLGKYNFCDKYHKKMFQTQVTVVCRAVCCPHNCDNWTSHFSNLKSPQQGYTRSSLILDAWGNIINSNLLHITLIVRWVTVKLKRSSTIEINNNFLSTTIWVWKLSYENLTTI